MLLYTRRATPKAPKRRSRAGCVHCKEKKKKCSEERPSCQRCIERGLECHYEPIQPRRRRRTASPADPSRPAGHSISTGSSPTTSFKSRVESLRRGSSSGAPALTVSVSSPALDSEASWDMPSSYDETASQYGSDFRSDDSASPDIMEAFPRTSVRHSSVPVESMDMFLSDYDRRRSLLSTPELMSEQFRRASHAGTPDMMSVPYRRTSDSGVAEVYGSIPFAPSQHVDAPDVVTSAPVPSNSNFHQTASNFIAHPDPCFHPSSNSTSNDAMGSASAMQQMTAAGFYQTADAFEHPNTNVATAVTDGFYPSADAFVGQQSSQAMGNWAAMDQMNQNFYMTQRR